VLGVSVALLTAAHLSLPYVQVVFGRKPSCGAQTRQEFLTRRFDYYLRPYADEHLDKNVKLLLVGNSAAITSTVTTKPAR